MITIITTIEITIFEMRMQFLTDGRLVKGRLKKLKDEIGKFYENQQESLATPKPASEKHT